MEEAPENGKESSHSACANGMNACFIKTKICQSLELNSSIQKYNTRRKINIHVQSYKTDIYKESAINMRTKLHNKMPGYTKEMDNYKAFKKELKSFLLYHALYSVEDYLFVIYKV